MILPVRLGVCATALALVGCDTVHLRLHEREREHDEPPAMDAATPGPERQPEAGPDARDAFSPPEPMPDAERPTRADSGPPPVVTPDSGAPPAVPTVDSLVLRYDFSGSGNVVRDLVGNRDARLRGGTMLSPNRTFIG